MGKQFNHYFYGLIHFSFHEMSTYIVLDDKDCDQATSKSMTAQTCQVIACQQLLYDSPTFRSRSNYYTVCHCQVAALSIQIKQALTGKVIQ